MADRLWLVAGCAGLMGGLYVCAMRASPGRGWMRAVERVVAGIILCYLCHVLGMRVPQGPISALAAGFFGLPGVALTAWMGP